MISVSDSAPRLLNNCCRGLGGTSEASDSCQFCGSLGGGNAAGCKRQRVWSPRQPVAGTEGLPTESKSRFQSHQSEPNDEHNTVLW